MTRFIVTRPEPGNAATMGRVRAAGLDAVSCPLFAIVPVAWTPPDLAGFDALLLTSANAARLAGAGLAGLAHLPVVVVGAQTAAAARAAGLHPVLTGTGDAVAAAALARSHGFTRLLHLAGRDRTATGRPATVVYASDPVPVAPAMVAAWREATVFLHSARAACRCAALAGHDRCRIGVIAISAPVLAAAGDGWRDGAAAAVPTDEAMIAAARRRLQRPFD